MSLTYETVDVFTDTAFGGNPLAVVFGGKDLSTERMQAIAIEFNYSETTFVLPPTDPANTAHVRIFTPTREVPFAGHPNVGTATVLAWRGAVFGRAIGAAVRFEEAAGLVPIAILNEGGRPVGAQLTVPQPFQRGEAVPATDIAACLGLDEQAIRIDRHPPVGGTVGLEFILVELTNRAALEAARPVRAEFETRLAHRPAYDIHCYVRATKGDAVDLRTRMFAPLDNIDEDPATGSANGALVGLLAELDGPADGSMSHRIAQGVEMGRPSLLLGEADRAGGVTTAIRVGGRCVAMMRGEIVLP
ncbi:MAG: PhzF family phenazine biosynthesis protein [Thalassobaculaceae bacterium]|nr:PhzF family phenazine biosynthesis protein [Thalassobaculaceae bacterium]